MLTMRRFALSALFMALLGTFAIGTPLRAQEGPVTTHPWNSLSPAQRGLLAPLQQTWSTLPAQRQTNLLKRTQQWMTWPPERQEQVRQNLAHWQEMTPEQREKLHDAYQRYQQMTPAQRETLRNQWKSQPAAARGQWIHQLGAPRNRH